MREFGVGNPVRRVEDDVLVRGRGRYVDDIRPADAAALYVLRSPHGAAAIRVVDVDAARASPGVLAILTFDDVKAAGLADIKSKVPHLRADGSPHLTTPYNALAPGSAPHAGDGVVAIVAETLHQAKDAAELIEVEWSTRDVTTDTPSPRLPSTSPSVWAGHPDNVCFVRRLGDPDACSKAFASAAHIVRQRFVISRVATCSLETRGAIGEYDRRTGRYQLTSGLQMPHESGRDIASAFGVSPSDVHVIAPDIGGGFGMKLPLYQEYFLVLLAAKRLGRPVKWVAERSESFLSDQHARDNVSDVALALDAEGLFLGLQVETVANLGAYIGQWSLHVPTGNLGGLAGVYRIPAFDVVVTGVFSNTAPTGAFRGAGRPEASYCIERIVDLAAHDLCVDPVELRRKNMIRPEDMPYDTGLVFTYDCGDFPALLDAARQKANWTEFPARQAASRKRGRLRGRGLAYVIEIAGGPPGKAFDEHVEIRFDSAGTATVLAGIHSHGQGHETTLRQFAAEFLSLPFEDVRVVMGDTDKVAHGRGTFGSRSVMAAGSAFRASAAKIVEKGTRIAALLLEVEPKDVSFDGHFAAAGTNRSVSLKEVAQASYNPFILPEDIEIGLSASTSNSAGGASYPNGCHICEVEVDPETGVVELLSYLVVEDVGTVVNPLLLKGQIQGGVAQGAGQALMEQIVYDGDSGQLLTGSFMDYALPRAHDFGGIEVESRPVPTRNNPLGAKGAGEAGAVGALPAVMNAVGDALRQVGVRHFDMPATPQRVWRAIHNAAN